MNTTSAPLKHRHGLSLSTHHRLGYPMAGWFSPEPPSVSPSHFILHKVTSNTTRHAFKNLRGLGTGPQVCWTPRKGIRKSFSESVLTKSMTVADPNCLSECVFMNERLAESYSNSNAFILMKVYGAVRLMKS